VPEDPTLARADSLAFLVVLFLGIATAILTGARFIPRLLETHPEPMLGLFMGLILASVVVPWRMMRERGAAHVVVGLAVAAGTFALMGERIDSSAFAHGRLALERSEDAARTEQALTATTLFEGASGAEGKHAVRFRPTSDTVWPQGATTLELTVTATRAGVDGNVPAGTVTRLAHSEADAGFTVRQAAPFDGGADPPLWYVFVCGAIAICAMILPGVSGSFLLLVLGMYGFILSQLHAAIATRAPPSVAIVAVFLVGIAVGILSFSRVLHWLLEHAHDITMAALIGLMLGSLRKLWPFQRQLPDGTENVLPQTLDGTVAMVALLFAAGMLVVVALEWTAKKLDRAAA
jgi:uncharacterized membrane protein